MANLTGPFSGDMKSAPSAKENANGNSYETSALNKPADGDVIKPVFYDRHVSGSPAALDTPNGTATSVIGKTPNFSK